MTAVQVRVAYIKYVEFKETINGMPKAERFPLHPHLRELLKNYQAAVIEYNQHVERKIKVSHSQRTDSFSVP